MREGTLGDIQERYVISFCVCDWRAADGSLSLERKNLRAQSVAVDDNNLERLAGREVAVAFVEDDLVAWILQVAIDG